MTDTDWTNDAPDAIGKALADKHLRVIKEAVTMTDDRLLTSEELNVLRLRWHDAEHNVARYGMSRMYVQARADIPALLAHIRAQDAELARLRDALAAVCKAAVGVKPDPFTYAYPACAACGAPEDDDGEPRHLPDCPVAAARALLDA